MFGLCPFPPQEFQEGKFSKLQDSNLQDMRLDILARSLSEGRKVAASLRSSNMMQSGPAAAPGLAFEVIQNIALYDDQERKLKEMFNVVDLPGSESRI